MTEPGGQPIDDIAAFIAVADAGSFTRAAETLGTSKSNVGKAVQRLELRLGTRLFQRTTRVVRLTEDGETYVAAARSAFTELHQAEVALAGRREDAVGRVRLDVPVGFGRLLMPALAAIRAHHPRVDLELSLSDRASDAVGEGWDLVVRVGPRPPGGEMTVRKLCNLRLGLYASPRYVEERGAVTSVAGLAAHDAIVFRAASGQLRGWPLAEAGRTIEWAPPPRLVLRDGRGLVDATIAGLGIAQIFDHVARPHVAAGELRRVLPAADVDGPPVHALVPLGRRMPAKTRVVLDALATALRQRERK
jgi:DNA-binding transcriptional LysR family regulator